MNGTLTKILSEIIHIQSISGQEAEVFAYISRKLKVMNITIEQTSTFISTCIPGVDREHALIFNAHVDTVEAGNLAFWDHDPFSATWKKNKLYGLGASDEKGAVAILLTLVQSLLKAKPAVDVWLTFVGQEETTGQGTQDFLSLFIAKYKKLYKNIAAVICEPTASKNIGIGHKGNLFIKLTTQGESGHGSRPDLVSRHAVFTMFAALEKLKAKFPVWEAQFSDKLLGQPSCAFATSIAAGSPTQPNKFPDQCSVTCDIRTTPDFHSQAINLIKKALPKVKVELVFPPFPPSQTENTESIVRKAQQLTKGKLFAFPASCDLCFFTEAHIPAIILGPGDPAQMHKPNESVPIKNLKRSL